MVLGLKIFSLRILGFLGLYVRGIPSAEAAEEGKSSPCPNYVITFVYPRMTSSKFCEKKVPPARAFRALILPPPLPSACTSGSWRDGSCTQGGHNSHRWVLL